MYEKVSEHKFASSTITVYVPAESCSIVESFKTLNPFGLFVDHE